jgi:transposase InsO family protein
MISMYFCIRYFTNSGFVYLVPSNLEKERSAVLREFVHADVCGPIKEKSIGGARYYLLFKDDSIGYMYVYFLKQKSEVFTYFKQMIKELERDTGHKLKKFHSDRGGEFCSKAFDSYLLDNLIKKETSAAATPQQNGFIERDNRTVTEAAQSMIHDQGLLLRV